MVAINLINVFMVIRFYVVVISLVANGAAIKLVGVTRRRGGARLWVLSFVMLYGNSPKPAPGGYGAVFAPIGILVFYGNYLA